MNLADVFSAVAFKRLTQVELPGGSHEHELSGSALREFFDAAEPVSGQVSWQYRQDDAEPEILEDIFTFYDARAKSATRTGRSEWRLRFREDPLRFAMPSDVLLLLRLKSGGHEPRLYAYAFERDSAALRAAKTLFGLGHITNRLQLIPTYRLAHTRLEFVHQLILDDLDLGMFVPPAPADVALVRAAFPDAFPSSETLSAFARVVVEVERRAADRRRGHDREQPR